MTDPIVSRRWPEIIPILAGAGLEARFVEAEDESVDDAIEIRPIGASEDEDLADVQICFDGLYCGNSWTSASREARRHGASHATVLPAIHDLLANLRRDGMIENS